jgi:2-haloacid dehalogenase
MSKLNFQQFEVLSFDCYGTLIDWESGILGAVRPVLANHRVTASDEIVLEAYAAIESEIEAGVYRLYRDVLKMAMTKLCERFGFVPNPAEKDAIVRSLPDWPPFADTVDALKALKSRYKLAIISNIDDDLFAGTNRHLGVTFDYIITAAQVRAYKPSPKVFEYALEKIGCDKGKLLHVAQSLYHDHVPAKRLGLSTVWINRRQGKPGTGATLAAEAMPDGEFAGLAAFVTRCCPEQ